MSVMSLRADLSAAIMPTEHALALIGDKSIIWPKSGSAAGRELAARATPDVLAKNGVNISSGAK